MRLARPSVIETASALDRSLLVLLAYPTLTLFQSRLAMSHSYVGLARQRTGRPAEAVIEFRRAVAIMERLSNAQRDSYNLYNLACFRSSLSGIGAQPGSGCGDTHRFCGRALNCNYVW